MQASGNPHKEGTDEAATAVAAEEEEEEEGGGGARTVLASTTLQHGSAATVATMSRIREELEYAEGPPPSDNEAETAAAAAVAVAAGGSPRGHRAPRTCRAMSALASWRVAPPGAAATLLHEADDVCGTTFRF